MKELEQFMDMQVKELARLLGIGKCNLFTRIRKDGVKTLKAPVMTSSGPKEAAWVPQQYAEGLLRWYAKAYANTEKGS